MNQSQPIIAKITSIRGRVMSPIYKCDYILLNILTKDQSPLSTAINKLQAFSIPEETRKISEIITELEMLYCLIKNRWNAYQAFLTWRDDAINEDNPTFIDENNQVMDSKDALSPCQLVNNVLNQFVELTLKSYTPNRYHELIGLLSQNVAASTAVNQLREIAIHAEEAMEKDAVSIILNSVKNNPRQYKRTINSLLKHRYSFKLAPLTHDSMVAKITMLKILVVDYPRQLQKNNPLKYKEMIFPYFHNYTSMVQAELALLKVPFFLQNSTMSFEELLMNNFEVYSTLQEIHNLYAMDSERDTAIAKFMGEYPELFGVQELSQKVFTFVGAGFPLTGIILHILTGGAKINLVEYNPNIVKTTSELINILEDLSIVDKGAIQIIYANALDLEFLPILNSERVTLQSQSTKFKSFKVVFTDILDLASALPAKITRQMFEVNARSISIIRKRNVSGTSEFLYERFNDKIINSFHLVGEIAPPQQIVNQQTDFNTLIQVADPHNVNSSSLYINLASLKTNQQDYRRNTG